MRILNLKISNLKAIAWHLEQGEDNGNLSRESLAFFLRHVADELEEIQKEIYQMNQAKEQENES